jgi:flagellar assembly protein FliH
MPDGAPAAVPVPWRRIYDPPPPEPEPVEPEPVQPEDNGPDVAELERQWAQKSAEAYAAGMRDGEAAGRSRAAAELQAAIERLARSVDDLAGLRVRLRKEAEADLVQLALAIARRILRRELSVDPDALRGVVAAALEKLGAQEICRVKVHPSHAVALAESLRDGAAHRDIQVVPDASREPGAAVFETERGNLDASVESQLEEIGRGLADHLRKRS